MSSKPINEYIFILDDFLKLDSLSFRKMFVVVGVLRLLVAAEVELGLEDHVASLLQQQVPIYELVQTMTFYFADRVLDVAVPLGEVFIC